MEFELRRISAFESEIDKILETRLKSRLKELRIDQN
jgi:hypothetical protein